MEWFHPKINNPIKQLGNRFVLALTKKKYTNSNEEHEHIFNNIKHQVGEMKSTMKFLHPYKYVNNLDISLNCFLFFVLPCSNIAFLFFMQSSTNFDTLRFV